MAPKTWNTSSPAAEEVSRRFLEAHKMDARALRVSTVSSSSRSNRPQAVEPSDAETVPGLGVIHELGESWALKAFSGDDVYEHPAPTSMSPTL